jgi:hypothetical protein
VITLERECPDEETRALFELTRELGTSARARREDGGLKRPEASEG